MAGLLSAYQMNGEKPEERFLVSQAQALADSLSVGWHNGNKIPLNQVNLLKKAPKDTTSDTNLAAAGTLSLEWATLSKYTGEEKYAKLALGSIDAILSTTPHFPYLWSNRINPSDLSKTSTYISLGGGYDSFVEYMIKYPVLVGNLNHPYAKVYAGMVDAISERLVIKTGVKGLKFTADYNIATNSLNYVSSHLACFLGGNIVYAGKLHRNKTWLKLGLELTESCYLTFRATATGVAPYSWGYFDEAGNATGWGFVPSGRREFYNEHGLFVQLGDWLARPEIIESLFYAWRATGNPIWRQYAWEAYQAIKKTASTPSGAYAGIVNTNDPSTDLYDQTESTLYAEVFKYLYLIFSDSSVYSLDEYLFTARGHILKRGGGGGGSGGTKAAKGTSSPVTKRLNAQENTIE
jgi:mannosyl-oligosaccharide alpha-1,2-mannosidase